MADPRSAPTNKKSLNTYWFVWMLTKQLIRPIPISWFWATMHRDPYIFHMLVHNQLVFRSNFFFYTNSMTCRNNLDSTTICFAYNNVLNCFNKFTCEVTKIGCLYNSITTPLQALEQKIIYSVKESSSHKLLWIGKSIIYY